MMPRLIHGILAIDAMRPDFFRDEFVLRAVRVVWVAPRMVRVLALHFLQEYDIGVQLAQAVAQLVQHHAAVELGEALVDIVGGNLQRWHDVHSTQSARQDVRQRSWQFSMRRIKRLGRTGKLPSLE